MTVERLWHSFRLLIAPGHAARAEYIRKHNLFGAIGKNCMIHKRKIPLYPKLIRLGNNVVIAANVSFLTHDGVDLVLNNMDEIKKRGGVQEHIGCIEIGDNVFVGSGTHILYGTKIGSNVIIGTCSVVTHDIPDNSIAVGVPAKVIGKFDDHVEKLLKMKWYPEELKPKNQTVSDELAKLLWERFEKEHSYRKTDAD